MGTPCDQRGGASNSCTFRMVVRSGHIDSESVPRGSPTFAHKVSVLASLPTKHRQAATPETLCLQTPDWISRTSFSGLTAPGPWVVIAASGASFNLRIGRSPSHERNFISLSPSVYKESLEYVYLCWHLVPGCIACSAEDRHVSSEEGERSCDTRV